MMKSKLEKHRKTMDDVYKHPIFPKAIDLWTFYVAKSKEIVQYFN